jgi:hypothetical protein
VASSSSAQYVGGFRGTAPATRTHATSCLSFLHVTPLRMRECISRHVTRHGWLASGRGPVCKHTRAHCSRRGGGGARVLYVFTPIYVSAVEVSAPNFEFTEQPVVATGASRYCLHSSYLVLCSSSLYGRQRGPPLTVLTPLMCALSASSQPQHVDSDMNPPSAHSFFCGSMPDMMMWFLCAGLPESGCCTLLLTLYLPI